MSNSVLHAVNFCLRHMDKVIDGFQLGDDDAKLNDVWNMAQVHDWPTAKQLAGGQYNTTMERIDHTLRLSLSTCTTTRGTDFYLDLHSTWAPVGRDQRCCRRCLRTTVFYTAAPDTFWQTPLIPRERPPGTGCQKDAARRIIGSAQQPFSAPPKL